MKNTNISSPVIFLTEHFHPSNGATAQLITDLVADTRRAGIPLKVLTSTPKDPEDESADYIYRTSKESTSQATILSKTLRGLRFLVSALVWLSLYAQPGQTIFIVSNPPFVGIIGLVLRYTKRIRYIFLLQDVFPRSATLTGLLPSRGPGVWFWRKLLSLVLHNSSLVVTLSSAMVQRCKDDFGSLIPIKEIHNWSILDLTEKTSRQNQLAREWGLDNIFTIQYSGNFGRLHDLLTILEAARLLEHEPIMFVFIGDGAKREQIEIYKHRYTLNNIVIKPFQDRAFLAQSLMASDLSFVSMIPGADDTIAPSKLYGILSLSKPVVLIGNQNSELANILREYNCGIVIPNGDPALLASKLSQISQNPQLLREMSENSFKLYNAKYGRERSTNAYISLFRGI